MSARALHDQRAHDLLGELRAGLGPDDIGFAGVRQLLIVHNVGAVPATGVATSPTGGRSGFNVIALDGRGAPTHFCKCRPSGDPDVAREVLVARAGELDPDVARHLPRSRLSLTTRLSACVSTYEAGASYRGVIGSESTATWAAAVEAIVAIVERMAPHVERALGGAAAVSALDFATESQWALEHLDTIGLSPERRATLARTIASARQVPARLQHGDLWPSNILRDRDRWTILDLENFGVVRAPLYDVLHLLHTSFVQRRPGGERSTALWLAALRGDSADAAAARGILLRAVRRHALGARDALAAFAYYVVDLAARIHARGVWGADWRVYLAQAELLADLLDRGLVPGELGLEG